MVITIVVILLIIALLSFIGCLSALFNRRLFTAAKRACYGALLFFILFAFSGISLNLLTYHQLSKEVPVATLSIKKLDAQKYEVTIHRGGKTQTFMLKGDQWLLAARVIKWRPMANLLGLHPLYRLEKIEGQYADIYQAQSTPSSVYPLSMNPGIDLWQLTKNYGRWIPWIDTLYGSAVYMPMANDAQYSIWLTTSGLIARPINPQAKTTIKQWR